LLTFPTFNTQAIIGKDDLYLDAVPMLPGPSNVPFSTSSFHRLSENTVITEFQKEVLNETDQLDNLLLHLRQYYDTIKTKHQLQFEVPAGFCQASIHQRERNSYRLSQQSNAPLDLSSLNIDDAPLDKVDSSHDIEQSQETSLNSSTSNEIPESNINTNSSTDTVPIPIIQSVDKPSSSIPNMLTVSEDFLRASLGFRRIDTIKKHFSDLYCPNIRLDTTPADAVLDLGDLVTLCKKNRNTNPVPRPSGFGQVMHMDIVFGPEVSLGNIHYGLLFTSRFSRMTYLYPLSNLTTAIPLQLEAFFAHLGFVPKRLTSAFDLKLIGGKAWEYLNS
jgi:hypothetical protein